MSESQQREPSCQNCMYCLSGHCCRYPPVLVGGAIDSPWVAFPEVNPDWWCGEWSGRGD